MTKTDPTNKDEIYYCERRQGQRGQDAVTKEDFDAAHKLDSHQLEDGVTKYLAINRLRVVELYRVPAAALARFVARLHAIPGAPL